MDQVNPEAQNHNYTSPLRYPGGKGMLANFLKLIIAQNALLDGQYVEIYAGGASIAWSLLFEEYVEKVHINDVSKPLFAFWKAVLEDTDELCKLITDTAVNVDEWKTQKAIQADPNGHSSVQ